MDRLTKADSKYTAFKNIKLQQYENTGLAPGEAADLRANNYRLRAQLTEANAAREQAEAALGEAVGVLEKIAYYICPARAAEEFPEARIGDLEDAYDKLQDMADQFLQPRPKAMEGVKG